MGNTAGLGCEPKSSFERAKLRYPAANVQNFFRRPIRCHAIVFACVKLDCIQVINHPVLRSVRGLSSGEDEGTMKLRSAVLVASLALCGGAVQASAATLSFDSVQFPGTGLPLSVTGSDGTIFTFTAGPSSQFEAFQSGGIGSFPAGQFFLAPGLGNTSPITVAFSAAVNSISLPVSSDRTGDSPFTSTVQFFDGATNVSTVTQSGNTLSAPDLFSYGGTVTSLIISTSVASAPFGYTQNIGGFSYNVSSVPLPASAPMFGAALLALAGLGYAAKRKKASAAI